MVLLSNQRYRAQPLMWGTPDSHKPLYRPAPSSYTTNAIESLNARFRKAVRHRGHFSNEQAALKVLYLVATDRRPNRSNPIGRINTWKKILNTLTIHYGDRIATTN
jgi:transposase-like protein